MTNANMRCDSRRNVFFHRRKENSSSFLAAVVASATFTATAIAAAANIITRCCCHQCRNIAVSVTTATAVTSAVSTATTATATVAPSSPVQSVVHPHCHSLHAHVIAPHCRRVIVDLSCQPPPPFATPITGWLMSVYSSRRWGVWGHHLPFLFSGLVHSPSSSFEKCVPGAAELRPPRRLSLRSQEANSGHTL